MGIEGFIRFRMLTTARHTVDSFVGKEEVEVGSFTTVLRDVLRKVVFRCQIKVIYFALAIKVSDITISKWSIKNILILCFVDLSYCCYKVLLL